MSLRLHFLEHFLEPDALRVQAPVQGSRELLSWGGVQSSENLQRLIRNVGNHSTLNATQVINPTTT